MYQFSGPNTRHHEQPKQYSMGTGEEPRSTSKVSPLRHRLFTVVVSLYGVLSVFGVSYLMINGAPVYLYHNPSSIRIQMVTESGKFPRPTAETPTVMPCNPKRRIVFIKTHKTGSSTITTILQRYGYGRDLNFALPKKSHAFTETNKFTPSRVYQGTLKDKNGSLVWQALGGFHIMASHTRYDRQTLESVLPNATYLTIIRDPAAQLESAFGYFSLDREISPNGSKSALEIFLADPMKHFNASKLWQKVLIRNGQIYDLGLDHKYHDDAKLVDDTIKSLSEEMDLVVMNEYFDESLVLLKKLLCWDFDDIVYISKGVRQATVRRNITSKMRTAIEKWNHVDVKLYELFNKTFWEEVRSYGPNFQQDLDTFRKVKAAVMENCLANATIYLDTHKEDLFKLPANASEKCRDLVRYDKDWVPILRKAMAKRSADFLKICTPKKGRRWEKVRARTIKRVTKPKKRT